MSFQFKQFSVNQEGCAMKICTDACILGAYAPIGEAKNVLDIGTGTGLISLMLAQRFENVQFEAVEIDEIAAQTAQENFENSPFKNRLKVFCDDIKDFASEKKYDLVISNPPFYESSMVSQNKQINLAMHNESLRAHELAKIAVEKVAKNGKIIVLYPLDRMPNFVKLMAFWQFYPEEILHIYHLKKGNQQEFRQIITFVNQKNIPKELNLHIWERQGVYSQAYIQLLQNFYTIF